MTRRVFRLSPITTVGLPSLGTIRRRSSQPTKTALCRMPTEPRRSLAYTFLIPTQLHLPKPSNWVLQREQLHPEAVYHLQRARDFSPTSMVFLQLARPIIPGTRRHRPTR